ncbi:hypothetical protein BJX61DRAFT_542131 [Aspergillus egyptiacus]|nr:hypothetical protein BJX61DRAFT_542131 [Aspergillus egyptiacus]
MNSHYFFKPLRREQKPRILFRVEDRTKALRLRDGRIRARNLSSRNAPTGDEFRTHLQWRKKPTRFISFFSSWGRAMAWRNWIISEKNADDPIVTAISTERVAGIYDAEEIATALHLNDPGKHRCEFLVDGYVEDEYAVLAVFEGRGYGKRPVKFEVPGSYQFTAEIPKGFFSGRRADALQDLAEEMYNHTGVSDDVLLVEMVRLISRTPLPLRIEYENWKGETQKVCLPSERSEVVLFGLDAQ